MLLRGVIASRRTRNRPVAAASGAKPIRSTGVPPRQGYPALREDTPAKLPEGLKLADWMQIRAEYESRRHGMLADGEGGYQSRAHQIGRAHV